MRPTGRRVLIRPDRGRTETASGILIPDRAQSHVAMSGEIVALGPACWGPSYRTRAAVMSDVFAVLDDYDASDALTDAMRALLSRYYDAAAEDLRIGDAVCFPYTAGTDLTVDGEAFLVVKDEDLVATWHPDTVTVETAA